MNGNNTQSQEGFIKGLAHPRKIELAEMLMAESPEVEAMKEAGYDRITILEMARSIKTSVEGMEDLNIDIPRTEESKSRKTVAAEEANNPSEGGENEEAAETANIPETANANPSDTAPVANETAPVDPTAGQVVDENAADNNVPPAPQS